MVEQFSLVIVVVVRPVLVCPSFLVRLIIPPSSSSAVRVLALYLQVFFDKFLGIAQEISVSVLLPGVGGLTAAFLSLLLLMC